MAAPTCKCPPLAEAVRLGLHRQPLDRCEVHGTLGSHGKADTERPDSGQPAEPMALNSTALEESLLAALTKPQDFNL